MKNKAILFTVLLATPLLATMAQAQTTSEATVKAAITRMLTKPDKALSDDLKAVVNFAEASDKVTIEVLPGLLPLGDSEDDKAVTPIFLGYYSAGAIQYDLAHPKQAKDPLADKASTVKALLIAYHAIQKKNPDYKQPLMEKLTALDSKGQLPAYIRFIVNKPKSK